MWFCWLACYTCVDVVVASSAGAVSYSVVVDVAVVSAAALVFVVVDADVFVGNANGTLGLRAPFYIGLRKVYAGLN